MANCDTSGWHFVHIGIQDADLTVGGIDPWDFKWRSAEESIEVPHPSYPSQRHMLHVWNIDTDHGPVTFAAGELSNGVWCFYEPGAAP